MWIEWRVRRNRSQKGVGGIIITYLKTRDRIKQHYIRRYLYIQSSICYLTFALFKTAKKKKKNWFYFVLRSRTHSDKPDIDNEKRIIWLILIVFRRFSFCTTDFKKTIKMPCNQWTGTHVNRTKVELELILARGVCVPIHCIIVLVLERQPIFI